MGAQHEDTSLHPERSVGCYNESSILPTAVVGMAPASPDRSMLRCSMDKLTGASSRNIILGQVLSLLIAMMSISAASLEDRGVSLPCFVNFINYGFITINFGVVQMLFSRRSLQLQLPWRRYFFYALVDVEANTLAVLAYRYTSITSVAMLDAFSIPAVMVLSRFVLRARYTSKHLMGVALCLTGLALTIVSDLEGEEVEMEYPHALKGDLLCILGAGLYAGSNVMQEDFVKNHERVEFLGMAGFFGVIISGLQTFALERHQLAEVQWTPAVVLFTFGYALSLSVMYSWTSLFLQAGDAALFNLSLLTSDVYALLFSFLIENITPNWLYFVAFAVISCGLVVYHGQPAPTSSAQTPPPFDGASGLEFGCFESKSRLPLCGLQERTLSEGSTGSSGTDDTYCGSLELSPAPCSPRRSLWHEDYCL